MGPRDFLYLGASDWAYPAWRQAFYPEGLPEDWLLSYYNTRFQAVYLPAARWRVATPEQWRQWLDDTRDGFVFLLEDDAAPVPVASARVRRVSAGWEAGHVWWLDEAFDLRALAGRIAGHAASGAPLFVISRRGDLERLGQVESLRGVMGY